MAEALCWRCRRPGTSSCSWDKSLTPVDGWTASVERWGESGQTFCVISCPLFVPMCQLGRDGARGLGSVLTNEMLEHLVFKGFNDREIAEMTRMAASTIRRRRLAFLRRLQEEEQGE